MSETTLTSQSSRDLLPLIAKVVRQERTIEGLLKDLNGLVDAYEAVQGQCQTLSAQLKDSQATVTWLVGDNTQLQREKAALESKLRSLMQLEAVEQSGVSIEQHASHTTEQSSVDYTSTDCSLESLGINSAQFRSSRKRRAALRPLDEPLLESARKSVRAVKANRSAVKPPRAPSAGVRERSAMHEPEEEMDVNAVEKDEAAAAPAAGGGGMGRQSRDRKRRSRSVPVQSPHRLRSDAALLQMQLPASRRTIPHATSEERLNELGHRPSDTSDEDDASNSSRSGRREGRTADEDVLSSDRSSVAFDAYTTAAGDEDAAAAVAAGEEEGGLQQQVTLHDRPHVYVEKRVMLRDVCDVCGNGMGFGATSYKCNECRQVAHLKCCSVPGAAAGAAAAALPCMPKPEGGGKKMTGTKRRYALHEWCSTTATPMIPQIVLACVLTIERRFMGSYELHRLTGTTSGAQLLHDLKSSRSAQIVGEKPPETISSALKQFLKDLAKPVVHESSLEEMIGVCTSTRMTAEEKVNRYKLIIDEMSRPHRDTFAFVARHLQKVAAVRANRMNLTNLASVFAPLLMDATKVKLMAQQRAVLQELLQLVPADFYDGFGRCGTLLPAGGPASAMSTIKRRERALETPRAGTLGYSVKGGTAGGGGGVTPRRETTKSRPALPITATRAARRRLLSDNEDTDTENRPKPQWR